MIWTHFDFCAFHLGSPTVLTQRLNWVQSTIEAVEFIFFFGKWTLMLAFLMTVLRHKSTRGENKRWKRVDAVGEILIYATLLRLVKTNERIVLVFFLFLLFLFRLFLFFLSSLNANETVVIDSSVLDSRFDEKSRCDIIVNAHKCARFVKFLVLDSAKSSIGFIYLHFIVVMQWATSMLKFSDVQHIIQDLMK